MINKLIDILKQHEGKKLGYYMCTNDGIEIGTNNLGKMSFTETSDGIYIIFKSITITIHDGDILSIENEDEHEDDTNESLFSVDLKNTFINFYENC
jgi:hypothetical protein